MTKTKSKKNIFIKLKDFFIDVKNEGKKVVKPSFKELLKYSIVTLGFIVIICLFFVLATVIITFVKELIG